MARAARLRAVVLPAYQARTVAWCAVHSEQGDYTRAEQQGQPWHRADRSHCTWSKGPPIPPHLNPDVKPRHAKRLEHDLHRVHREWGQYWYVVRSCMSRLHTVGARTHTSASCSLASGGLQGGSVSENTWSSGSTRR
jgi:hypothetical protein